MYQVILSLHSIVRWFVLIFLLLAIYRAIKGLISKNSFSKTDATIRQLTVSMAHIQLLLGIILYFVSPLTSYMLSHFSVAIHNSTISFIGMSHTATMLIAVVVITIGLRLSKKSEEDNKKFSRMLIFYSLGLILILIMVPWPFSPFVQRSLLTFP